MKRFFLFSAIMAVLLIGAPAFPMDMTPAECRLAADNFLKHLRSPKQVAGVRDLLDQEQVVGRLMELTDGGYLVVSATPSLPPIKAYSLSGRFADLPSWYHDLLLEALSRGRPAGPQPRAADREAYHGAWDYLLNDQHEPVPRYVAGTVLLTTRWGQGYPYNKKLPTLLEMGLVSPITRNAPPIRRDDAGVSPRIAPNIILTMPSTSSPAGCSAPAGGAVVENVKSLMQLYDVKRDERFHDGDHFAIGYIEQTLPNGKIMKSGPRIIHPENLVDELTAETPEYQEDEVAMLIREMAMLFESNYGVDSTSGSINVYALSKYFGMVVDIRFMENDDNDLFFQTIKSEIDQERPVLFILPGHGAVADGYVSDETGNRVHLNMGWNGQEDDFYYVDEAIATDLITFSPSYQIIYNLKPSSAAEMNGYDDVSQLEDGDAVQGDTLTARFNTEFDIDRQDVYLKGPTTFTGAREGSLNQGFYIMVFKENGVVVETFDQPTTLDLPSGKYIVETCLRNRYGDGYFLGGDGRYTLTIDTQPLSDAEIKEIDEADIPPEIQNDLGDMILTEPFKILIDAVDEDNDAISITARSSRGDVAVSADAGLLTLTPTLKKRTVNKGWSRITVSASANGKDVEKSFIAFLPEDGVPAAVIDHNGELPGVFESQTDMDAHKVFLDGEYRFQGFFGDPDRQWFFLSVLDSDGNIVVPPTDEFVRQTFEKGFYVIQASLDSDTSFYPFDPDADNEYVIFVDCISGCSDSGENRTFIADLLDLDAPPSVTDAEYRTEDPSSPLHGQLKASDPDGDNLTFTIVDPPGRGVLDLDAVTGVFSYSPGFEASGTDQFQFKVSDGLRESGAGTATITVDPVPSAQNDNAATKQKEPVVISVLADNGNGPDSFGGDGPADSDLTLPDGANGLTSPSHGEVALENGGTPNDPDDDAIVYSPAPDYAGTDAFEYRICDADGDCDAATVTVTVNHVVKAGDLNDSGGVDLTDVVLCLQVLTGVDPAEGVSLEADVNGNGRIGPEEAVFSLEAAAGLR